TVPAADDLAPAIGDQPPAEPLPAARPRLMPVATSVERDLDPADPQSTPTRLFFQGRVCSDWGRNRFYRVILEPQGMLFYHLPHEYVAAYQPQNTAVDPTVHVAHHV